jgi:hypothetical protein
MTILAGVTMAAVVCGSAIFAQDQALRPGVPTQARVKVENRGPAEAVPVTVAGSLPVTVPEGVRVAGTVALDPSTTIHSRAARHQWDYRTVAIRPDQDAAAALNAAGTDGWEAAGVLSPAPNIVVLLKRVR